MSQPSILISRLKISRHKVSMSQHSALCQDSGVRRCVTNKAECTRDRGTLLRVTKALYRPRPSWARKTGMRAQLEYAYDRGASATKVLCDRDSLSRHTCT